MMVYFPIFMRIKYGREETWFIANVQDAGDEEMVKQVAQVPGR
jgi:hypothetical protein